MQSEMTDKLVSRTKALLADKTVQLVLGWRRGLFDYDVTPSLFTSADDVEKNFVYNEYSAANLSKYLVKETRKIETAKNTGGADTRVGAHPHSDDSGDRCLFGGTCLLHLQ